AAPAALEDARASEADGLGPGRPQGTPDAHEQRIRGRNVRAARFEREVRLAVDGDGTLYVGLGGRRLQLRVLHELGAVLGAPDDATAERRAAVVTGHEVEGRPSAEGAPAAAWPANGDLARGRGSQARLADAEEVARRLFRVDALDLRVHAGRSRSGRHFDLELPGPPQQRGLPTAHVNALLVPRHVARVAGHGHAVERALRAVQAAGHAQVALLVVDRSPELPVTLEAEIAGQDVTVQDREVHLTHDSQLRAQRGERHAAAV